MNVYTASNALMDRSRPADSCTILHQRYITMTQVPGITIHDTGLESEFQKG